MKVLATRKTGIEILYLVLLLVGILLLILASKVGQVVMIIGTLIIVISALVLVIDIYCTPKVIMTLNETEDVIVLSKNRIIKLTEIEDISYYRAHAKGIVYKWGSITIKTNSQKYKCKYVADCEDVSKVLTDLVYKARYNN